MLLTKKSKEDVMINLIVSLKTGKLVNGINVYEADWDNVTSSYIPKEITGDFGLTYFIPNIAALKINGLYIVNQPIKVNGVMDDNYFLMSLNDHREPIIFGVDFIPNDTGYDDDYVQSVFMGYIFNVLKELSSTGRDFIEIFNIIESGSNDPDKSYFNYVIRHMFQDDKSLH